MDWIEKELESIEVKNLYRKRLLREGLRDFCSNDYLALKEHPEVIETVAKALREYGLGSGASALVSGYTIHHKRLEESLAKFKGTPCCVLFGSGYLANIGTIPALVSEGDVLFSDELNHASIIDACRLSRAKVFVYKHLDYEHLEELLRRKRAKYRRALIVSDTVFSMDGDVAHIPTLKKLCKEYHCMLYLDEAHATGVLGNKGMGGLEEFGERWDEFMVIMGTLSKALGSYGAFVCSSEKFCEYMVNKARSLIFSTSLPPAICAGAEKALEILQRESWRVRKLREISYHLYARLRNLGFEVIYHNTPIIPIMVYTEAKAVQIRDELLKKGILLQAIRYPTVPEGKARLRLTASLRYSEEEINLFLDALKGI
ncbi:MAG: 8-amino-7-oxononanoate synthase [Aquificaceae bacterium]|nr:8-amino-7-oxononanoate synthase [Aquificaceae bacterium]